MGRYYYMDLLRSVLMLLGVFYHTAFIYMSEPAWKVFDHQSSPFFDALIHYLHSFRMPAFFVVAGYFAHLTFSKYGLGSNILRRVARLGVPFVAMVILVQPIEYYIEVSTELPGLTVRDFVIGHYRPFIYTESWIGHLWFLSDLGAYYVAAAVGLWLVRRLPESRRQRLNAVLRDLCVRHLWLIVVTVSTAAYLAVYPVLDSSVLYGFLRVRLFIEYAAFFAIGMYLRKEQAVFERFMQVRPWQVVLALATLYASYVFRDASTGPFFAVYIMAHFFCAWVLSAAVFRVFKTLFDRPSRIGAYLSDASYTVYLFHMVFIYAFALAVMRWQPAYGVWIKYVGVTLMVMAASLAVHHWLVRPFAVMRWLFNGVPMSTKPKRSDAGSVPQASTNPRNITPG